MGAFISRPDEEPSSSSSPPNLDSTVSMSASASETQTLSDSKPADDVAPEIIEKKENEDGDEEEEEEKGECGFCLFMKGGGCKESFVAWENCIEEAEKTKEDIAQKCFDITSKLRECMVAHPDYYEPILRAEKAAEEEAIKELDKEKEKDKENEAVIEVGAKKPEESPKQEQ